MEYKIYVTMKSGMDKLVENAKNKVELEQKKSVPLFSKEK